MQSGAGLRLFIGWLDASGKALATCVASWAERILPSVEASPAPDLREDRGWRVSLRATVQTADAALVCAVGEQALSPWLHLQLGACLGAVGRQRPVVPILLDFDPATLAGTPFGLFQAVNGSRQDFRQLLRDLARAGALDPAEQQLAVERFESDWSRFQDELDLVPGTSRHDFQIVLVLPDRVFPIPNSRSAADEEWSSVVRRSTAVQSLPGVGLPAFRSADLRALDLAGEEWMRPPRLVSRLRTRSIALVHHEVSATWHGEAKAVAKMTKQRLASRRQA